MNIFVARLSYGTTADELRSLFEPYGALDSVKIIMDRETGRSKGYGFVEMPNDSEAEAAIANLNGTDLEGREIVVKKANPPRERSGGYRDNRGGGYRDRRDGGYRDRRY